MEVNHYKKNNQKVLMSLIKLFKLKNQIKHKKQIKLK